jgi:glycosyltransferase involved in cell wall biosynthesis
MHDMHVLRMGFRPADFARDVVERESSRNQHIRLAYAGRLNPEHRNASRFLELYTALQTTCPVRLFVAGTELQSLEAAVKSSGVTGVEIVGSLLHADFIEFLKKADVLVLFGNRSRLQVPGKLYQYLGALKPILYVKNMGNHEYDETEHVLGASKVPHVVVPLEGDLQIERVGKFLTDASKQKVSLQQVVEEHHSWDQRGREMMAIVDKLSGRDIPASALRLRD